MTWPPLFYALRFPSHSSASNAASETAGRTRCPFCGSRPWALADVADGHLVAPVCCNVYREAASFTSHFSDAAPGAGGLWKTDENRRDFTQRAASDAGHEHC